MPGPSDIDLYRRGVETAIASWAAIARGSRDAAVARLPGLAAAVFPHAPERSVYNNAVLEHGLGPAARAAAIGAMESAYATAGVTSFAAWIHETDAAMRVDLKARGYAIAETTRAMGMALRTSARRARYSTSRRPTGRHTSSTWPAPACRPASCATSTRTRSTS